MNNHNPQRSIHTFVPQPGQPPLPLTQHLVAFLGARHLGDIVEHTKLGDAVLAIIERVLGLLEVFIREPLLLQTTKHIVATRLVTF